MLMGASLRPPNLCMLFEWCEGGSLYHVLRRAGSDLGRQQRLCIAACVASAIAFLHTGSPAIIHRDIKAQNVLLDDPVNPVSAKLCDFGLAIKLSDAAETNACQGTPPCVPPASPQHVPPLCKAKRPAAAWRLRPKGSTTARWHADGLAKHMRTGPRGRVGMIDGGMLLG